MKDKIPISPEWKSKLMNGYLIRVAKKNEIDEFLKEFPKDMDIPKELLLKTDEGGNSFLLYAASNCCLDKALRMSKELNIDLRPLIKQNQSRFRFFARSRYPREELKKIEKEFRRIGRKIAVEKFFKRFK